jgi:hypothetical protein
MKKLCILAALVLFLAPMSAMAGMSVATDGDLQDITGQTGVTISMNLNVTATGIAWGDSDGFGTYNTEGWVILSSVDLPSIILNDVTIDAGYNGTFSYLAIGTGGGNVISGDLTIKDLIIGSTASAAGPSAGEIRIEGIGIGFGTIRIGGH